MPSEETSGSAPGQTSTPVPGDGVLTIEISGTKVSVMDPDMFKLMIAESAGNVQASNRNSRNMFDIATGAMQGTMVQNFKDVGAIEGRTVSGLLATPLASPTAKAV